MMPQRIAILGASGHIGSTLALRYAANSNDLLLVSRSHLPAELQAELARSKSRITLTRFDQLDLSRCDLIINATGPGDPAYVHQAGAELYRAAMAIEDRIEAALNRAPGHAILVFMSSGAVFGNAEGPFTATTPTAPPALQSGPVDWYGLTKAAIELRHRALRRSVLDIRVLGYITPYLDTSMQFLLSDVIRTTKRRTVMVTSRYDLVRDFVGAEDLAAIIDGAAALATDRVINLAVDTYSCAPCGKFEILRACEQFGLSWRIDEDIPPPPRRSYWSQNRAAAELGYRPTVTSLERVVGTVRAVMNNDCPA